MNQSSNGRIYDCIVVGGGPAGLTAAIYLARYHLSVLVFDDQASRAASIPVSHNHAGFPNGVSGEELLARMRTQAERYGAYVRYCQITELRKRGSLIEAMSPIGHWRAKTVLLATGVINRRPQMPAAVHDDALARGLLRYCPVCDGFEVTDKTVGVIGVGTRAFQEAIFLRSYTRHLTIISCEDRPHLNETQISELQEIGVKLERGPVSSIEIAGDLLVLTTPDHRLFFASVYPALGSDVRSDLASRLGARLSREGCVSVDAHQRTTVSGLYAAGDVVQGLDQISRAMGQAGVAATAIRNDLCEQVLRVR